MVLGFNGATTLTADLGTDIRAAKAAGYGCLEIWAPKLLGYFANGSLSTLRDDLKEAGLPVATLTVIAVPSPKPKRMGQVAMETETVRVLRTLAGIAAEHQVRVALEFLGFADCSVNTLEACWRVVKKANRPNVGLVFDTFHFHAGNSSLKSIAALDPTRILMVHLNDVMPGPRARLHDARRLYPGDGVLPLTPILQALRGIGYAGPFSVEIFQPRYWRQDPMQVAATAYKKARAVLEAAGWH
ncbi:MAG: sugar phosphate isomerase/epimerase [candidate division NC10 bacterium]|nr:sugar phosphate isomerase/epimerase [candidate division NC10 bacterium]